MKKDLEDINVDVRTVEMDRITKTRRLQQMVKIGVVVMNCLVLTAYIAFVVGEVEYRKSLRHKDDCTAKAYLEDGGSSLAGLFAPYAWARFGFSIIINVWLIIVTCMLSTTLRGEADGGLLKEYCRLLLIIWGFILTYIGWTIYVITASFVGYESLFELTMAFIITPGFCNFAPISLVFYTHFRNVTSVSTILSSAWSRGKGDDENEEGDGAIDFAPTLANTQDITVFLQPITSPSVQ